MVLQRNMLAAKICVAVKEHLPAGFKDGCSVLS